MADTYAVVLRECAPQVQGPAGEALARIFGIKAETCQSVVGSAPIVLVDGLSQDEGAILQVALHAMVVAGARLEFTNASQPDLPRINWPQQPQVFRIAIATLAKEFDVDLPSGSLMDQLRGKLSGKASSGSVAVARNREVFSEADLGEITPFSNAVLPTIPSGDQASGAVPALNGASEADLMSRMDELFPDEDGGIIPNTQDITNMLNRLLPDGDGGGASASGPQASASGGHAAGGGHSVFLAKISDENRRKKAVPLLVEMIGISEEDAEKLAKKVIIPVLKGVSKEDAEAAKHKFAEIGVLARIKGG